MPKLNMCMVQAAMVMNNVAKVCLGAVLASVARHPEEMLSAIVSDPIKFPEEQSGDLEHSLYIYAYDAAQAARRMQLPEEPWAFVDDGLLEVLVPNQPSGLKVSVLSITGYAVRFASTSACG